MKRRHGKHYRRAYRYDCKLCGKPRYAFVYERAKAKVCRKCERDVPNPNQIQMFPAGEELRAGDLVVKKSDGKVYKARPDSQPE